MHATLDVFFPPVALLSLSFLFADDADESDAPLPLSPPLPLASASPLLGAGGHRASLQSMRSSATRSALQGGRCESVFFFFQKGATC